MRCFIFGIDVRLRIGKYIWRSQKEIDWDGLTSNQQASLSIVYNKGSIRTKELAVHLGKSPNTAKKIFDGLVASEILKKVATSVTDRNQYYTFYA